jgi:hypothetical protein
MPITPDFWVISRNFLDKGKQARNASKANGTALQNHVRACHNGIVKNDCPACQKLKQNIKSSNLPAKP